MNIKGGVIPQQKADKKKRKIENQQQNLIMRMGGDWNDYGLQKESIQWTQQVEKFARKSQQTDEQAQQTWWTYEPTPKICKQDKQT